MGQLISKLNYSLIILTVLFSSCRSGPTEVDEKKTARCYSQGMVVSAHPLASDVGLSILKKGGNAFDAAIAVKLTLAVVYPRAGNIAGGGFMVYRESTGETGALNFREKAPLAASRDMFLNEAGEVIEDASTLGHLSVGVPGVIDGLVNIHEKYGTLEWEELVQPAIDYARNGFELTKKEADKLNQYQVILSLMNPGDVSFLHPTGEWQAGDSIHLPLLASSLERIRDGKRAGFYEGETAELLLEEIENGGGIISQEDLDTYESVWTETISDEYRRYTVYSMPPPSSGGIALLQLLKGIEKYDVRSMGHNTAETIHLMTELERRVYADRATHLGDPDFWEVPYEMLLDPEYLESRNSSIDQALKTNSTDIKEGEVERIESVETTHFSIVDNEGNAVAISTTLNGNYGSKVIVDGAGFFLNNQMDDFSIKPGHPNMYGLLGAEANAIASGKRMLSSMTPTIVEKDGELFMVLGTPGGATIITSIFQNILNVIDHDMTLEESISSTRVHSQWLPDKILYEYGGLDFKTVELLEEKGHELVTRPSIGRVDAVLIDEDGCFIGVGDQRGDDTASGF